MVLNYILVWYPCSWSLVLSRLRAENVLWFEVAYVTSIVKYIFKSVFQHHSKVLFGGTEDPPPVPPETLLFGLLLRCLHYYKCRHCKIWRNFWVPSPFKPNIFSFDPLLNTYFFMVPHQIPPATPPPPPLPDNTWTVSKKVFLAYSLLHISNKTLVAFTTIDIINN